ncbi:MAG TPA: methyl-accepting chemotaxis protein, partial [Salinarimonas sp.]|nr:methyl-accepting chemotaxis protein [Salinarimonas sp.]
GSVEAARAGASGRGFAVVSSDIRGLAREASESLERVKDTVRGILDQIASVRREMEQTMTSAEIEVQNASVVFTSLERIEEDVAALGAGNQVILRGSQAILAAATETAAGARQIAAAAEEAGAASRQAAAASSEQAQGAEDLAAAIEEIASLADELKQQND